MWEPRHGSPDMWVSGFPGETWTAENNHQLNWMRAGRRTAMREPTFEFALGGIMWGPRHGSPDMWVSGFPGETWTAENDHQ